MITVETFFLRPCDGSRCKLHAGDSARQRLFLRFLVQPVVGELDVRRSSHVSQLALQTLATVVDVFQFSACGAQSLAAAGCRRLLRLLLRCVWPTTDKRRLRVGSRDDVRLDPTC